LNTDATYNTCSFLVDTGADISLINQNKIRTNHPKYRKKCTIHGVTSSSIESELAITSNILLNHYEKCVKQEFQVVDNDFPIPANGILGETF
jgi:hypothetical protein